MLQVGELSLQVIDELRPLIPQLRSKDRSLADQLVRAATSVCLNIGEGDLSDPGNQRARFFTAAGSAGEALIALRTAARWRYIAPEQAEAAESLLRRVIAMLWKLTRK